MPSYTRTLLSVTTVLLGSVFLAGCASTPLPVTPTATPSPVATEISSSALLTQQQADVLDQILTYPSTSQAQVSSSIITIPVGMETGLHKHDAPMYAYVLTGQLTVTYDGGVIKTYKAGEAIMEAVGTAHNGQNTGTVPVEVLVVNFGADGVANTVKLP